MFPIFLSAGILTILTMGCSKDSDNSQPPVPVVTTTTVTAVTDVSAIGGGSVTSNGGDSVTNYGICWGLAPNPTIADSKILCTTGMSNFSGTMGGLTPNTPYYVRAFATNSAGTGYGDEKSFTTQPFTNPRFSVVKTYLSVSFELRVKFACRCLNDDVRMTKVVMHYPYDTGSVTWEMNNTMCQMNQQFELQNSNSTYEVIVGDWTFEFIGTRASNGESFDVFQTVNV